MAPEQLESVATRGLKIEKFKQVHWGQKLESYFLERKSQLDKVIYSLIRTEDHEVAQEFYFRLQEGEQTFADWLQEQLTQLGSVHPWHFIGEPQE